jgi:signal transduction histidine kinase/CheY-like chemotaxis protein
MLSAAELAPSDLADIELAASRSLARQSVASVYGHAVLAAILLGTTTLAASHPGWSAVVAGWMAVVAAGRLCIARVFPRMYPSKPARWTSAFRLGLVLSSATWGVGGASLLATSGRYDESSLVLMCLAGVSAAGLTALSASRALLRVHIGCLILPMFCAAPFLPGGGRHVVGFVLVLVAYGGFLWVQGGYAPAAFRGALVNAKLLEHQAMELDRARLESVESSRVKSEFLANMSHEIRTPLTAILGYTDLLLDESLGPRERVSYLQTIRSSGEHLLSVINDILDVSKIEAGKMTVERISTAPAAVLAEVASTMQARAVAKGLSFEVRYETHVPMTMPSDPTRLKQILMNLVSNAIKFTEIGSVRVFVRFEHPGSEAARLVVDVEDTGIGMSAAEQGNLFRSFVQADASTTRRFGGSGLGLVISRRLARLLGGDLSLRSAPGRGSVFTLALPTGALAGVPLVDGVTGAEPSSRLTPSAADRRLPPGCRVLLAEDGPENQVIIRTYLAKAGAEVTSVGDGQLAVEEAEASRAAGRPYDVVLMDMQMPRLDGYGATQHLRAMKYPHPIVALTAHAMAGDRERCEQAGCDDYLAKPIDRAELVGLVARYAAPQSSPVLVSLLQDDEDIQEIIVSFVEGLPARVSSMMGATATSDAETLERITHQLKGAAGMCGFPPITEAAALVEDALRRGTEVSALRSRVDQLAALCRAARAA